MYERRSNMSIKVKEKYAQIILWMTQAIKNEKRATRKPTEHTFKLADNNFKCPPI
jgi:hypothetical protein